jgi:small-conductance mechanosensitive channel
LRFVPEALTMNVDMERQTQNQAWRQARLKLIASGILIIFGADLADHYGKIHHKAFHDHLLSYLGDLIFVVFGVVFLHALTKVMQKLIANRRLGAGRAASIQFMLRLIGYVIILLGLLDYLNVPVGKLLLGGAVLGVILGVAAQQALGNFFASIILIIAHPYSVGADITITSGALGGKYVGRVKDIGLTHTAIKQANGRVVLLPNAMVLAGAAISRHKKPPKPTNA